jgi:hypothetical protein
MQVIVIIVIWLPFILLLLAFTGIYGTLACIQLLRDERRLTAETARTEWALELLTGYNENKVGTELQRWGIDNAIRHGLMPSRLTLRRWDCIGRNPNQLLIRLQARHAFLRHRRKSKRRISLANIPILRRSHA